MKIGQGRNWIGTNIIAIFILFQVSKGVKRNTVKLKEKNWPFVRRAAISLFCCCVVCKHEVCLAYVGPSAPYKAALLGGDLCSWLFLVQKYESLTPPWHCLRGGNQNATRGLFRNDCGTTPSFHYCLVFQYRSDYPFLDDNVSNTFRFACFIRRVGIFFKPVFTPYLCFFLPICNVQSYLWARPIAATSSVNSGEHRLSHVPQSHRPEELLLCNEAGIPCRQTLLP